MKKNYILYNYNTLFLHEVICQTLESQFFIPLNF